MRTGTVTRTEFSWTHDRTPVGWLLDALDYAEQAAALEETALRCLLGMRWRQGESVPWDEINAEESDQS